MTAAPAPRVLRATVLAAALALGIALPACGSKRKATDDGSTYASGTLRFRHGELPRGWVRARVEGTSLTFDNRSYSATITAFANCKGIEDVSLRALVQQELVGVEKKEVLQKSESPVGGRHAADWIVRGALDGVTVQMELVVLRIDRCVYDLVLVSDPSTFEQARPDFQKFLEGFEVLE